MDILQIIYLVAPPFGGLDQLTLFQPGGVASAHPFLLAPQNFLIEFQKFSLHNFLRR